MILSSVLYWVGAYSASTLHLQYAHKLLILYNFVYSYSWKWIYTCTCPRKVWKLYHGANAKFCTRSHIRDVYWYSQPGKLHLYSWQHTHTTNMLSGMHTFTLACENGFILVLILMKKICTHTSSCTHNQRWCTCTHDIALTLHIPVL